MIRILGLVIMKGSEYDAQKNEAEERYMSIQNVANSNSARVISLQKKYDTLRLERNNTIRKLTQEVKALEAKLKDSKDS